MSTATETAASVVVCVLPFSGPNGVGVQGRKYRVDDPLVLGHPQFFADPDTPHDQRPTVFDESLRRLEAQNRAAEEAAHQARVARCERNARKLVAPEVLRAVRDILDLERGQKVLRGSTVLATDEVALAFPNDFKLA